MYFKNILMYFSVIYLFLTGCTTSYEYSSNEPTNNNIITDDSTSKSTNEVSNLNSNSKSKFFDYSDIADANSNSYYGKLKVNGRFLSDKNNNSVQLKGISTHGISWFPQYINKDTFKTFRDDWNMNVIRLAMYSDGNGGYSSSSSNQKNNLKSLIYDGIDAAKELNMYVIIDWHILSDNNPLTHMDEAIEFFNDVSKKYGNDPHILYEICNEPNGNTSWEDIKLYSNNVIPVIRNNAPDSIIIVGTPNWSQDVDIASKSPLENFDNIMYSLHFYADTHKDDLRNKMNIAIENELPIFVTEYGICDASGNGNINVYEANKWIEVLNKNKISYVAWNLSNKNESSAILSHLTQKTSNFSSADLSSSGEWLKYMLTKNYTKDKNNTYIEDIEITQNESKDEVVDEDKEILISDNTNKDEISDNSSNTTNNIESSSQNNNSSNTGNITSNNNTSNNQSNNNNNNNNNATNNNTTSNGNSNNGNTNTTIEKDIIQTISTTSNLKASYNIESYWEESGKMCYLYRVSLTNVSSSAISNWSINITLKNNIELRSFWNSAANASSNVIKLDSLDYNKTINPNSSIQDIGFIVKIK